MAVKDVGTNWNRTTRSAIDENDKNLQRQINELVLSSGDSNVEVAQARVDAKGNAFNTLKDRLDENEIEISLELSQTKGELNYIKKVKADTSYVDKLMSNITDGTPKELFDSIASLETKYPDGSDSPVLVNDDSFGDGAHVFMWVDGQGWIDVGLYQSRGIKDESIGLRHLSTSLVQNIALDEIYANWELGGLNANTGETLDSTTRGRIEDYVLINQGTIRSLNPNEVKFRVFEYGFGKDFISVSPWLTDNDYAINEPRFIKVMMAYQDDRVISDINLLASYLEIKDEKIADGSIGINKLSPQLQSIFINEGDVW